MSHRNYKARHHELAFQLWLAHGSFRQVEKHPEMPHNKTLSRWAQQDYRCPFGCSYHGWEKLRRAIDKQALANVARRQDEACGMRQMRHVLTPESKKAEKGSKALIEKGCADTQATIVTLDNSADHASARNGSSPPSIQRFITLKEDKLRVLAAVEERLVEKIKTDKIASAREALNEVVALKEVWATKEFENSVVADDDDQDDLQAAYTEAFESLSEEEQEVIHEFVLKAEQII